MKLWDSKCDTTQFGRQVGLIKHAVSDLRMQPSSQAQQSEPKILCFL